MELSLILEARKFSLNQCDGFAYSFAGTMITGDIIDGCVRISFAVKPSVQLDRDYEPTDQRDASSFSFPCHSRRPIPPS
ncbi:hypothetical protein BSY18_3927 (plasmid) [Blastomonas sp. RAC04]|nr:hypothetical protein BSY18_3927 [Blastomonas sp. RAC04]